MKDNNDIMIMMIHVCFINLSDNYVYYTTALQQQHIVAVYKQVLQKEHWIETSRNFRKL